jgi:hypothetical protein
MNAWMPAHIAAAVHVRVYLLHIAACMRLTQGFPSWGAWRKPSVLHALISTAAVVPALTGSFAASSCSMASSTTGAGTAPAFATHDLMTDTAVSVSTDAVSSSEDSRVQLSQSVSCSCDALHTTYVSYHLLLRVLAAKEDDVLKQRTAWR